MASFLLSCEIRWLLLSINSSTLINRLANIRYFNPPSKAPAHLFNQLICIASSVLVKNPPANVDSKGTATHIIMKARALANVIDFVKDGQSVSANGIYINLAIYNPTINPTVESKSFTPPFKYPFAAPAPITSNNNISIVLIILYITKNVPMCLLLYQKDTSAHRHVVIVLLTSQFAYWHFG